jgi:holo-[acyl-carrier protein] synthase
MLKGIGTDIVEIRRIEKLITRYGEKFLRKIFTDAEMAYCARMSSPAIHFAGRWAAKEAFYKALPLSCQAISSWKSMQVVAYQRGGPVVELCSSALQSRVEKEGIAHFHLSISHEREYCIAVVVAE